MAATIYRSPLPDIQMPEVTVTGLIDSVIAQHPGRIALVDALSPEFRSQ